MENGTYFNVNRVSNPPIVSILFFQKSKCQCINGALIVKEFNFEIIIIIINKSPIYTVVKYIIYLKIQRNND